MTPAQFEHVTRLREYPGFLQKHVQAGGNLHTCANGEINCTIKGVHAKVSVLWNFEAPAGTGDTHASVMRGSKASLAIPQGEAEGHQPVLYVEPSENTEMANFATALERALPHLQATYPGVGLKRNDTGWEVTVPASYPVGHEAHFGQVTGQFLTYVANGALPAWEVPNMLAKHYTTTHALSIAKS